MSWFLIGALAPFFWAITNFFDKVLVERYYKGVKVGAILFYFTSVAVFLIPFMYFLSEDIGGIPMAEIAFLMVSALFYTLALVPYFEGLNRTETSLVVPLFQLIPIFNLVLGYFILSENVAYGQMLAAFVIIFGAVGISLDFSKKIALPKFDVFLAMALSSLLYSLGNLTFKLGAEDYDFWAASFWVHVSYGLQALVIFFLFKKARTQSLDMIKKYRFKFIRIITINSTLDAFAKIAFNFALFSAPIFLASVVNGLQPVFVFLMGVGLTLLIPKWIKEDLSQKALLQKIFFIVMIFAGGVLLNISS